MLGIHCRWTYTCATSIVLPDAIATQSGLIIDQEIFATGADFLICLIGIIPTLLVTEPPISQIKTFPSSPT